MVRLFLSKAGSQCCYICIFHCLTFNVVSFCLILREILVLIHLELFVWNSLETQCIFTKPVPHRLVEPINTTAISVYNCCCTSPRNFITVVSHLSLPNSPHELSKDLELPTLSKCCPTCCFSLTLLCQLYAKRQPGYFLLNESNLLPAVYHINSKVFFIVFKILHKLD